MASKIEQYTAQSAKVADKAVAEDMIATVKTALRTERKKRGTLMIAAAYATHAGIDNGLTLTDIAKVWADEEGTPMSSTTMTLYRRLGAVAIDLGILPPSEGGDQTVWSRLAGKGGALTQRVADQIDGKFRDEDGKIVKDKAFTPTKDGVLAALDVVFTPDGKKRNNDEQFRYLNPDAVQTTESSANVGEGGNVEPVPNTRSNEARILGAVKEIEVILADLTEEEWARVFPRLAKVTEWVDSQTEKRAASKKAAEKSAS